MAEEKSKGKEESIEKKDKDGNSPLHAAAKAGHSDVVRVLLDLGSSLNEKNNCGETALHLASRGGHKLVVDMLLEAGADLGVEDENGATPWHLAAAEGHASILSSLATRNSLNVKKGIDDKFSSILCEAAKNGEIKTVIDLLKKGVDINAKNKDGEAPIYIAATNGHCEVVKVLLQAGADWRIEKENGTTLLHELAAAGHADIIKILTDNNMCNGSILCISASKTLNVPKGNRKFKKKKMDNSKEEKNVKTEKNRSRKWEDIYKKLELEYDLSDNDDEEREQMGNHSSIINEYVKKLFSSADDHELECVRQPLENLLIQLSKNEDFDLKKDVGKGFTFLHIAAACAKEENFLKNLLKRRGNPKARTEDGITTIMCAAAGGSVKNIKVLIEAGADPFAKDVTRKTALHFAVLRKSKAVIKYLLTIGLDPEAEDINNVSPLHFACMIDKNDIVPIFFENMAPNNLFDL